MEARTWLLIGIVAAISLSTAFSFSIALLENPDDLTEWYGYYQLLADEQINGSEYTNNSNYLGGFQPDHFINNTEWSFNVNSSNSSVYLGGNLPDYYITPNGYNLDDAFVNSTGDIITGDLNFTEDANMTTGYGFEMRPLSNGGLELFFNV